MTRRSSAAARTVLNLKFRLIAADLSLDDDDHAPGRDGYVSSITPVRGQYVQHLLQRLSSRKCELLERLSAVRVQRASRLPRRSLAGLGLSQLHARFFIQGRSGARAS
jgi:hypothetical protein